MLKVSLKRIHMSREKRDMVQSAPPPHKIKGYFTTKVHGQNWSVDVVLVVVTINCGGYLFFWLLRYQALTDNFLQGMVVIKYWLPV